MRDHLSYQATVPGQIFKQKNISTLYHHLKLPHKSH